MCVQNLNLTIKVCGCLCCQLCFDDASIAGVWVCDPAERRQRMPCVLGIGNPTAQNFLVLPAFFVGHPRQIRAFVQLPLEHLAQTLSDGLGICKFSGTAKPALFERLGFR
jgi:hypothetical protein